MALLSARRRRSGCEATAGSIRACLECSRSLFLSWRLEVSGSSVSAAAIQRSRTEDTASDNRYKIKRLPRLRRVVLCVQFHDFAVGFREICTSVSSTVRCRMAGRSYRTFPLISPAVSLLRNNASDNEYHTAKESSSVEGIKSGRMRSGKK